MLLALLFGGVTLTLAPEAKVRGTEITLGAIAQVASDDAAEVSGVDALCHDCASACERLHSNAYRSVRSTRPVSPWQDVSVLRVPTESAGAVPLELLRDSRVSNDGIGLDAPFFLVESSAASDTTLGDSPCQLDIVHVVLIKRADAVFVEIRRGSIDARVADTADEAGRADQRVRSARRASARRQNGANVNRSATAFRQGELQPTGNPYDMAISGPGFFRVRTANGEYRYTRDGSFRVDGSNVLVTGDGYPLDPTVQIPPDAVNVIVGETGDVSVMKSDSGLPEALISIPLFRFANPSGLEAQGGNLYSETVRSGQALEVHAGSDGTGTIRQSCLELPNLRLVDVLAGLLLVQGNHPIDRRVLRVSDAMAQQVNNLIR